MLIPLEPKVGLNSNQAVNSRSKKFFEQFGPWKDPGGPMKCKGSPKISTFYGLTQMKIINPLTPKMGLTNNQALNSSLSIV